MKFFRSIIFWLHLTAGISAGLVIFIMSVTGVLLMYERQMLESADTPSIPKPAGDAVRMSIEQLLAKARAAAPGGADLSGLTLNRESDIPASAAYGREASAWFDPYTGNRLPSGAPGLRTFFRTVTDLHRWLAFSIENRDAGKAVTGVANLVFLFLVISGLYLWFPRRWSWSAVRPGFWFRRKLSGNARDWNWHNVLGFWCCIPLLLIVVSGALISYPWATGLLYRLSGDKPPPASLPAQSRGSAPSSIPDFHGLNAAWTRAEELSPGWQSLNLRLPAAKEAVFTIMSGHRGRPDLRSVITIDRETNAVVNAEAFADFNTGRKLRTWGRWIHTGEAGGIAGQTIAGIVSAAALVLVWTGFALAIRRLVRKLKSRRSAAFG